MNLETRVKEIETELAKIKQEMAQPEPEKCKRWRAERGGHYWLIDEDGNAISIRESFVCNYNYLYATGNYFQTEQEAEAYKKRLFIKQQLEDIALELNEGNEIDWENNGISKYQLYFDFQYNRIDRNCNVTNKTEGATYCLSSKFKDVAIERIGEEDLTWYLKGGK